ncbi:MAG: leucyl aminopeptidase family protein, partial [Polyangiaceae bacterium]
LGWALGSYVFDRYKKSKKTFARLLWPDGVDQARVTATRDATFLVRDLINTPAEDMGPAELAEAAQEMAAEHGGEVKIIVGDKLLEQNYPAIHAVGRAASRAPRLVDLRWGSEGPEITLVGKGIVFDSGGLDLKPASSMKTMKKDMGGAAHVLGVAKMVMAMGLPIRLRVLIPAAENAVSGNAFRPLDVLSTRKGLTVEVGNTDAEGRLVLADALTEAGDVDLLIDFATLTGAARVALGTDLPALFSNSDAIADSLLASGKRALDELWRMPLYAPYRRLLDSSVADMNNVADGKYGGAITAALFLKEFVSKKTDWVHIDVMAYNLRSRPGRPSGGEAMGMRAVYGLIEDQVRPPTASAV